MKTPHKLKQELPKGVEVEPPHSSLTPEQMAAKELAKQQSSPINVLLIKISKPILLLVMLALYGLFASLPVLWRDKGAGIDIYTVINIPLLAITAGYLATARDPGMCKDVLKILLVINISEILLGSSAYGSEVITLVNLGALIIAYAHLSSLRRGAS